MSDACHTLMGGVSSDRVQDPVYAPDIPHRSSTRPGPPCVPSGQARTRAPLAQIKNGSAWTGATDWRIRSN